MSESPEDVLRRFLPGNLGPERQALEALVQERDKAIRACAALRAGKEEAVRQRDDAITALNDPRYPETPLAQVAKLEAENAAHLAVNAKLVAENEAMNRVVDAAREAKRLLEDGMDDEVWYVVLGLLREALDALDNGETDESS